MKNKSSKPAVKVSPKVVNAVRGDRIAIECSPLGVPTPEFAWMKLRDNARSILLSKRNILIIEDVQLDDEGTYACRAWNRFGNVEAYTKVAVSSEHDHFSSFYLRYVNLFVCLSIDGYLLFEYGSKQDPFYFTFYMQGRLTFSVTDF